MARTLKIYSESFRGNTTSGQTVFRAQHSDMMYGDSDPPYLTYATATNPTIKIVSYVIPRRVDTWSLLNYSYWTAGTNGFSSHSPMPNEENAYLHYTGTSAQSSRRITYDSGKAANVSNVHWRSFMGDWMTVILGTGTTPNPYYYGVVLDVPFYYSDFDSFGLPRTEEFAHIKTGSSNTQHPYCMQSAAFYWVLHNRIIQQYGFTTAPKIIPNFSSLAWTRRPTDFPSTIALSAVTDIYAQVGFSHNGSSTIDFTTLMTNNSLLTSMTTQNKTVFMGLVDTSNGSDGTVDCRQFLGSIAYMFDVVDKTWWTYYATNSTWTGHISGWGYCPYISDLDIGSATSEWAIIEPDSSTGATPGKLLSRTYSRGRILSYIRPAGTSAASTASITVNLGANYGKYTDLLAFGFTGTFYVGSYSAVTMTGNSGLILSAL